MENPKTLLSGYEPMVEGAGSILDFADTLPKGDLALSDESSDWWAMRSDWEDLGRDFRQALSLPSDGGR